jgi:hypothetical protein
LRQISGAVVYGHHLAPFDDYLWMAARHRALPLFCKAPSGSLSQLGALSSWAS